MTYWFNNKSKDKTKTNNAKVDEEIDKDKDDNDEQNEDSVSAETVPTTVPTETTETNKNLALRVWESCDVTRGITGRPVPGNSRYQLYIDACSSLQSIP